MSNPAHEPSMVEVAEMSARRRDPSSPQRKRRLREMRRLRIGLALLGGSTLIYLWLLLT